MNSFSRTGGSALDVYGLSNKFHKSYERKIFDGYFLIHSSSPKTDEDATIISSFIGFLRNILIKYFLTALVFCYAEK